MSDNSDNVLNKRILLLLLLCVAAAAVIAREADLFPTLSSTAAIGKQPAGFYLLPTNQLLRPWGEQALFKGRPVDLAFDSQQASARGLEHPHRASCSMPPPAPNSREIPARSTSYTGLAFRPGDRELWASETRRDGPDSLLDLRSRRNRQVREGSERIDLPGPSAALRDRVLRRTASWPMWPSAATTRWP